MKQKLFGKGAALLGGLALLLAPGAWAQSAACRERTVVVSVVDKAGHAARGLTAADFQGKFRGQPVAIESAAPDSQPRRFVLVLDESTSMWGEDGREWRYVVAQARDFLQRTPQQDPVALIVFAKKIRWRLGFSLDRPALLAAVNALAALKGKKGGVHGLTALYDALAAAIGMFGTPHPGDAICVITDGGENASRESGSALQRAVLKTGVRVFAFSPMEKYLPPFLDQRLLFLAGAISDVVRLSGGEMLGFPEEQPLTANSLPPGPQIDALYSAMNSTYTLQINLPLPVGKFRGWKLELAKPAPLERGRWRLLYPRQLAPCGAARSR